MDYSSGRSQGCRIFEYTHRGLKMVSMENELIKVTVLVDKGSDIIEILHKPTDTDFMWKAPGGIRETSKFVSSKAHSLGNFLDYYEGGWQEVFPGGGPADFAGAELGLHGEVSLIPWDFFVEEDSSERISILLKCKTYRFPFAIQKKISLSKESAIIDIKESITNESGEDLEFIWGHHPALGKPFLDGDCRIDIPAKRFIASGTDFSQTSYFKPNFDGSWPKEKGSNGEQTDLSLVPSGEIPTADLFYLYGLEEGWYAVTNTKSKLGIGLCWDTSMFPYVVYWQVCHGLSDYPWYGRTYNIALEPWTSFPTDFNAAKANKTTRKIRGNETIQTDLKVILYSGLEMVNHISKDGVVE